MNVRPAMKSVRRRDQCEGTVSLVMSCLKKFQQYLHVVNLINKVFQGIGRARLYQTTSPSSGNEAASKANAVLYFSIRDGTFKHVYKQ